jgi:hypothetical protein
MFSKKSQRNEKITKISSSFLFTHFFKECSYYVSLCKRKQEKEKEKFVDSFIHSIP